MDGGADKYVQAGVQRTATADYSSDKGLEVVAEVHQFGSAAGAHSFIQTEPAAGSESISLGDAARLFGQSLVFCRGPYLVRLVAYQENPETRNALVALGRAIAAKL